LHGYFHRTALSNGLVEAVCKDLGHAIQYGVLHSDHRGNAPLN
jgi:hypothetical protein